MFGSRFCMGRVNAMEQSGAVFLAGDGVPERGADTLYAAHGLGVIACALARFAVPLFFMVSGYYLRRDDMTNAQVHERMCLKVKRFGGLLLNDFTAIGGHLWFIAALLCCYGLFRYAGCKWLDNSLPRSQCGAL